MSQVPVVAVIKAKKGKEQILFDVLKNVVAPTHQEKGCIKYGLHRSPDEAGTFVMVEKWESKETLDAHLASAHIAAAFARKEELIENISIYPLISVPAGMPSKEGF